MNLLLYCTVILASGIGWTSVRSVAAESKNVIVNSCHCALLIEFECVNDCGTTCTWMNGACQVIGSTTEEFGGSYEKWNGFMELAQTHVVMASGETRHAPKAIAEREAELLFTPTVEVQPTLAPTPSPTRKIEHEWGLETLGVLEVEVPQGETWDSRFPLRPEANVINADSNEYYIPSSNPNVNINFDLVDNRLIQGLYLKSWYTSVIGEIEVGLHIDDGMEGEQPTSGPLTIPDTNGTGWTWYSMDSVPGCCNYVRQINVPKVRARYVQFRLRGGSRDSGASDWGIRQIKISGLLDGNAPGGDDSEETPITLNSTAFLPPNTHQVRVAGYDPTGTLLGVFDMRHPDLQRPILEQALTTNDLGRYSDEAWSVTIPWNWMKDGVKLIVGTADPSNGDQLLLHQLKLAGLKHWGLHVLTRVKLIIFGTEEEAAALDTKTVEPTKVAGGMFNSIPTSELRWVDTSDLYLPYLVISTSNGPVLVHNEQERRDALIAAGDDPYHEPRWEILKNHFAFRHRLAHTGLGLVETTLGSGGSSPYSAGTSILQGWAMATDTIDPTTNVTTWSYNKMGTWPGWAAAAWTGWCGMKPGGECGNLLIHELGHSQTMAHFTEGSSADRGIEDEYPNDGVNEAWHPWGYDTTSRRFRTWYRHDSTSTPPEGKRDPMNGGEPANQETCYPQYTGYHAAKSLNWGSSSPQLLQSGMGPNVLVDGSYKYNTDTKQYDLISSNADADALVGKGASVALETGVPVMTIFGTLGVSSDVCQIYPEARSRHGNTFNLPNPYVAGHNADKFTDASYMVEITYETEPTQEVLIGIPAFAADSTELRFFSFTIALSKKPTSLKLYQFDTDAYPNVTEQSAKTLLDERTLTIGGGSDHADGLPLVVQAGRSWKGHSTELSIKGSCINMDNCWVSAPKISWSQEELKDLVYSSPASVSSSAQVPEGSVFPITVTRDEDSTTQTVNVVLARFAGDEGSPSPLLGSSLESPWHDPLTHGFRAWMPFDLNPSVPGGTYRTLTEDRLKLLSHLKGNFFQEFYVDVEFTMYDKTAVDLSDGATFTSESFDKTGTSAYFLVKEESLWGATPSSSQWWGSSSDGILDVRLYSDCLSSDTDAVTAQIKALQQNTSPCGTGKWQYNAGRSANDCPHRLVLTLREEDLISTPKTNSWISQYPGCTFHTHPAQPILIDSRRWHQPNSNAILGTMALDITVLTPGDRIVNPTLAPATSSPTTSPIQFPTSNAPTSSPIKSPTKAPSKSPTLSPTKSPSKSPTKNPTTSPTKNPTMPPTKNPTKSPTSTPTMSPTLSPTKSPTSNPTKSPTKSPSNSPTSNPTKAPTASPTKAPTASPTKAPTASPTKSPSKSPTSSPTKSPTKSPTSAPTPLTHVWGLEQKSSFDVALAGPSNTWADTYPRDKSRLLEPTSEYYLSTLNPDANINFDFGASQEVTGVWLQSWYVTKITTIEVGVHVDDHASFSPLSPTVTVPDPNSPEWTWFTLPNIPSCCNKVREVIIPQQHRLARYVQIKLRGASSSYNSRWGLRQVQISGSVLNTLAPTSSPTESPTASPTKSPTAAPTPSPTGSPTTSPTAFPTKSPTSAPTPFQHSWGMEQLVKTGSAALSVAVADPATMSWPDASYPRDISRLLEPGSEYYLPNLNPDVNLNFDFSMDQEIHGAFLQSWYVTNLPSIEVGVHPDDGSTFDALSDVVVPADSSSGWTWYAMDPITSCCNKERTVNIPPTTRARYVQFRLREASSSYSTTWGLRQVQISGVDLTTA